MLEGHFFNPAVEGTAPALIQTFGTLIFCAVFLFLWRHSGVRYFGFWSLAWLVESLALVASFAAEWSGSTLLLCSRAMLEFAFALSLLAAARSAALAPTHGISASLRSMVLFPGLLLVLYVFVWRLPLAEFRGMHGAILALIYGYSFLSIGLGNSLRRGIGGQMLRFTLAYLFLQYCGHAFIYFYAAAGGDAPWLEKLRWISVYDLVPQTLLAFSAMAMWIQTQQDTIADLRSELASVEQSAQSTAVLDHLTGLRSRSILDRYMDENFTGVVAVCDLDYFKGVNDRFGHLVGDDVLRHVGNLIRASIRAEDEAFRWGGDEFVILFRNQHIDLVRDRMAAMELRLMTFRLRGHGLYPLGLSWGAAEGNTGPLRPVLEAADHQMYVHKRQAHAKGIG